jgi:hypothetical protein
MTDQDGTTGGPAPEQPTPSNVPPSESPTVSYEPPPPSPYQRSVPEAQGAPGAHAAPSAPPSSGYFPPPPTAPPTGYASTGQFPPTGPPPAGPGAAGGPGYFGERASRRPEARLGTAFAGAGVAIAILGVLIWSVSYLIEGASDGGSDFTDRKVLGIVLTAALVLGGYAIALIAKRGPLVTLGVAASAIGVPLLLLFCVLDLNFSGLGSGNPIDSVLNLDVVYPVSVVVWLVSYFVVPVVRGHNFYLALAVSGVFGYVTYKVIADDVARLALGAVGSLGGFGGGSSDPGELLGLAGTADNLLDKLIAVGYIFGAGYYAIAFVLDAKGKHAVALPFLYGAYGALIEGLIASARHLEVLGTGLLLLVLGTVVAALAARSGRRFTTWLWTAGAALGLVLVIFKIFDEGDVDAPLGGAILAAAGVLFSVGGWVLSVLLREKDEFTPTGGVQLPLH